ncbi:hypothetical protein [Vulcanisaeta souniana]|uniref:Glycosyltransferase 2-like domain-containing protein n=1 Tax=Vulcanisaeta souniana JCM 11219 TaxID=1293586 RepID=A0A830EHX0_9CREN|nr:hypothetical protein [Vulcanisaeta souniana]BDR92685.1 hypothetical protein Vsou_17780 [Vulcanisaeta souniana JCM 11219]GGI84399.1 hypothetical protein GCM10007112_21700 [Vulcanisaeta souniana JCM 11219]
MLSIVAVIVTHEPGIDRLTNVLHSVLRQVDNVVIVDNDSRNKDLIKDLCRVSGKCLFIEIGFFMLLKF